MESAGFYIKGTGNHGNHGNGNVGNKCGRWNPTTEQVKVLTDLFRSGLRTPSTDQIQKISTQLSFYGKIESKNVFYWFQNHKARERQKRRKVSVNADKGFIRLESDKISTTKPEFKEVNQVLQPERSSVVETLQLFPLNSFDERDQSDKMRLHANDHDDDRQYKDTTAFTYTIETEMDHPPLDLRLSFL